MKQLVLATALTLLLFSECKKRNAIKVTNFEVVLESETVPAEATIILEIEVDGPGEYRVYSEGAYNSLEDSDSKIEGPLVMVVNGTFSENGSILVCYQDPGTYEVRLEVKEGDIFTETFTLISKLKTLQARKWKTISSETNVDGIIINTFDEELKDDYYEFKENMEYIWDHGEIRYDSEPEYETGTYHLSANEDSLYMIHSNVPFFLKSITLEKMEWEMRWTEIDGPKTVVNSVLVPIYIY